MSHVIALGYIGLQGPVEEWKTFGRVFGLQEAPTGSGTGVAFRVDERTWRLAVENGEAGLDYVGWEVNGPAALDDLLERLLSAGFPAVRDAALATERRVADLVRCVDPAGHRIELFYGAHVAKEAFVSPTGATFVTGVQGLGHVVLAMTDEQATKDFYFGLLGFKLTDLIMAYGATGVFTHVNPRHHSMAFFATDRRPPGLVHFMLQVDDMDTVGRTFDEVQERAIPVSLTIGKHTNDHMVSFYVETPSGCDLEYGFGARVVDDLTWTPSIYDSTSFWGHQRVVQPEPESAPG